MKPKLFIRIASVLISIFAVGHSIGHFARYNTTDSQALNTISAMQKTKIPIFFCVFCFSVTGFVYFFFAPTMISLLAAFSLLISVILLKKS
ncbi:LIC_13387 family protein [Leptospira santarosai]|uniref:PF12650 domain protein n=1 Tax=Leptospira santarosai TaxID=28183 RepID=A0AB73N221_9LEPT|nr:hypothetical protein [Leptospira santarosai]AVV50249.1 Uncharacterized protein XB17_01660 [Leptospira santarosai]ONF93377.1 hypothetical protein BWD14_07455 [Leptospira santarosai]